MRIIALSTVKAFLNRSHAYADAREPVMAWYRQVKAADWATPTDVKQAIRSASILKDGHVVFNLAGNNTGSWCGLTILIGSSTSVSLQRTDSTT